jgi:hypothetical protein
LSFDDNFARRWLREFGLLHRLLFLGCWHTERVTQERILAEYLAAEIEQIWKFKKVNSPKHLTFFEFGKRLEWIPLDILNGQINF